MFPRSRHGAPINVGRGLGCCWRKTSVATVPNSLVSNAIVVTGCRRFSNAAASQTGELIGRSGTAKPFSDETRFRCAGTTRASRRRLAQKMSEILHHTPVSSMSQAKGTCGRSPRSRTAQSQDQFSRPGTEMIRAPSHAVRSAVT